MKVGMKVGKIKVGSLPWLLRNEIRLWWRKLTDGKTSGIWMRRLGLLALGFLFLLWIAFSGLRSVIVQFELPESAIWVAIAVWLLTFLYGLSNAIGQSIVVLFERGDLDLLLSSPIKNQTIFASRLLSVAFTVFSGSLLLFVPLSIIAVLVGVPRLLGIFPALLGIALMAASLGMLMAVGMVRVMGARRARTWVQVLNTILTLVTILLPQLPNLLRETNTNWVSLFSSIQVAPDSVFGARSWIWFPARAILFDLGSVVLTLGVSGAIALFTVYTLNQAFIQGTQQSVTRKHRASVNKGVSLQDGFNRVVLAKEWRILRRNPYLISQASLQILLIIPLTLVILRSGSSSTGLDVSRIISFAAPLLGGQLSLILTSVCLSGEEAADLLKSSPVARGSMRRLKLLAALIPVWIFLLPVFIILIVQNQVWWPAFVSTVGATIMAAFLKLWNSRPVPPGQTLDRRTQRQGDLLLNMIEATAVWVWAGLGSLLYSGSEMGVILLLGSAGILFGLGYWRGRQLGSFLSF